ncbi:MAG: adenylate kinase [Oscillospiraceae bacterium]|nr:adenylate kinase [Oscillospiraceae bacterium]
MVVIIFGASHTGKTLLAQKILEKYKFNYLSVDHLKMGLIRSGNTNLTPEDDEKLTKYLWPIVREIIKTAIENGQNLTVEGCYIPFDWRKDFDKKYLENIKSFCLVMTENYIRNNFESIIENENAIEKRLFDFVDMEELVAENKQNLSLCEEKGENIILIDNEYKVDIEL